MSSEYIEGDGDAGSSEQKSRFCSSSSDGGKESCVGSVLVKLLVCVLCGVVFGVSLHKAHGSWIIFIIQLACSLVN